MESSMNKDKILTFDNMRKCYEPLTMSSLIHDFPEITRPLVLSIYPTLVSITQMIRFIRNFLNFFRTNQWEIFMIPNHAPSILSIANPLYHF